MTKVAKFDVKYTQRLNEKSELDVSLDKLKKEGLDSKTLISLYETMQLARTLDHKAIAMQRTGRLGTYASCMGQEAVGASVGEVMQDDDVFVQSYRETPALLRRGVHPEDILFYWGGDERGMDFEVPRQDMPASVPIATQCIHAVGIGYAMKLRKEPRVCVVTLGDGGTSKGDFYEAVNAAGVWQLPIVFVVTNNQWAISVPRAHQSNAETLAQKAIAGGVDCEQVDGNDVIGCFLAFNKAINRARKGKGPYLIEAITYRLSDHTTADDARQYRDEKEVKKAWEKEPITRLRQFLIDQEVTTAKALDAIDEKLKDTVEDAVKRYQEAKPQPPEAMFEYLYAQLPRQLEEQVEELKRFSIEGGE